MLIVTVQWIWLLKGYTVPFCASHHIMDCLISVTSRLTVSNPPVSLVLASEGLNGGRCGSTPQSFLILSGPLFAHG